MAYMALKLQFEWAWNRALANGNKLIKIIIYHFFMIFLVRIHNSESCGNLQRGIDSANATSTDAL